MEEIKNSKKTEETLTREFFMQNTGVYQTHSNFALIKLEFEESNLSPDAFCKQWLKDNESFTINLSGKIKIDASDDAMEPTALFNPDNDDITVNDVIESLSKSEYYWKSKCEALYEAYKEVAEMLDKNQAFFEKMEANMGATNKNLLEISKELNTCITDGRNRRKRKFGRYILPQ